MKFIDVAIPKFGDEALQQSQPAKRPPLANTANAFRSRGKIEEYNLEDEDHREHDQGHAGKADDSMEDPSELFYEAPDSTTDVSSA